MVRNTIAIGVAMATLTIGAAFAQQGTPRLDGVQTPGVYQDNQTGTGPRSGIDANTNTGGTARLDGVQTPGAGADNRRDTGVNSSSVGVGGRPTPPLDGVQTPGAGRLNQSGTGPGTRP